MQLLEAIPLYQHPPSPAAMSRTVLGPGLCRIDSSALRSPARCSSRLRSTDADWMADMPTWRAQARIDTCSRGVGGGGAG